jgi:ubiquitin thioesterase protein OTUB1
MWARTGHTHWGSAIIIALDFSLITGRFHIVALAFGFIEYLLNSPRTDVAVALAVSLLESTIPKLENAGFQKLVFEDFYEVFLSLIQQILVPEPGGTILTSETLLEAFQSPDGKF